MPGPSAYLVALDAYRIDHDLSWRALAAEMVAADCPVPARTLHYLCRRSHSDASIRDRTLLKIRAFMKAKRIKLGAKRPRRPLAAMIPLKATRARQVSA